jgi:hypothetical protein
MAWPPPPGWVVVALCVATLLLGIELLIAVVLLTR